MASGSKKVKTYHFHLEWEEQYFFTEVKDNCTKKKPYEDGEMVKQAFLGTADSLFANFKNKEGIVSAIKSTQLSANTVMRRVEIMSIDIFLQLRTDLDNCVYFSLQLDESTDVVDTSQMDVFVRMVFNDFTVIKIVNKIKAQALQRRLFKSLAHEIDSQYGQLLLHSVVRWLSRGRVLKRFNDVLSAIVQFFKQRDEPIPELENSVWLRDFGFLVDITEKLNELNLQLQGRDKELADMISVINAFIKKLEFSEQNLINHDAKHFPILSETISENPIEPYDSKYHVEIVSNLKDNFKNRFNDFNEMTLVAQFVVSPCMEIDIQQFATSVMQNFGEDIAATEMELIDFQNDFTLKSLVSSTKCIWPVEKFSKSEGLTEKDPFKNLIKPPSIELNRVKSEGLTEKDPFKNLIKPPSIELNRGLFLVARDPKQDSFIKPAGKVAVRRVVMSVCCSHALNNKSPGSHSARPHTVKAPPYGVVMSVCCSHALNNKSPGSHSARPHTVKAPPYIG
ncbi:hypothetical protein QE152_g37611 [Popillia japonica]|uniref:Uncharacterized protein n=1 Tax=Popillia japonica TaxID=7064 RepID=A0AAW1I9L5_POPJA